MSIKAEATIFLAQAGSGTTSDSGESWDLESFLENATEYGKVAGGALLSLMGLVGVVWGGVLLIKKLLSEQSRESWIKILGLVLVGGALLFGGLSLVLNFARGGQETIDKFGNGGGGVIVQAIDSASGGADGITYTDVGGAVTAFV